MVMARGSFRMGSLVLPLVIGACLVALALGAQESLGTAFTYQGQLLFEGAPVNESCDLRFSLWDRAAGGLQVGPTVDVPGHAVTGGMFTVTLDFGAVFDGWGLWLEIAVARPAGSVAWATLAPRQALLAVPYALGALSVPWAGMVGRPSLLGSLDGVTADQGNIDLVAGPNVTIASDNSARTITIGAVASGDITGVTAGEGLAGGGDSGAVALSLAAAYLDGSALDARFVNEGQAGAITGAMLTEGAVTLAKLGSGVLTWSNLSGTPAGFADGVDSDTQYAAGTGLALLGTTFAVDFAEVASAVHAHSGSQITSGIVAEARLDAALHRDAELKDVHLVGNAAGTTVLDEASAATDSGAALIGAFDEFQSSSATTVQGVLRDLDAAIVAGGGPQNLFERVALPDGSILVADSVTDLLTLAAGAGITITGDPDTDTATLGIAAGGVGIGHLAAGVLAWGNLTSVPAGFADGVDNDTTYSAGTGLGLTGTVFSVNFGAVAAAVHAHAGSDVSSGTVAEARVSGELARDSEVVGLVLAGDGSGSGLDADLLDGLHAAAFAGATHDHDTRYYTESELSTGGGGGAVHWNNLTSVPAGFADGTDNDTTYSAGTGLVLSGDGVFGLAAGGVTESRLEDGAVTAPKLASEAVASSAIADGGVAEVDLAPAVAGKLNRGPIAFAFIDSEGTVLAGSGNVACALAAGVYTITLTGETVDGSCVTVVTPSAVAEPVMARFAPTLAGELEVAFRETAAGPLVARDFHVVMFRGAASPGYAVSGRVTDGLGAGVPGVEVRFASLSSTSAPPVASVSTAPDGEWSKADLNGRVRVTPVSGALTFVPSHRDVTGAATGVDFSVGARYYKDGDGDGYGDSADSQILAGPMAPYTATLGGDCNEADEDIHPGATELCNGLDDDCDGIIDEEVAGVGGACGFAMGACVPGVLACVAGQLVCVGGIQPTPEVCDGIDNDCDGITDEDCTRYYRDLDADGYGDPAHYQDLTAPSAPYLVTDNTDCDDGDSGIHPGAAEVCDGEDNDCDGTADDGFDFNTDPNHCGGCGQTCDDGNPDTIDTCVGGECQHTAR